MIKLALALSLAGFLLAALPARAMDLGTNFWNLNWHNSGDCFKNVKEVTGEDPWNPQFLKEIAIYNSFRFMDWDNTNNSQRSKWSQRPQKSAAKQNPVAYEWMIDLCNRMNGDMWVTMPAPTIDRNTGDNPSDYALRLCILVKTGVDMKEVDLKPLLDKLSTMSADDLVKAGGVKTTPPLKENLKLYVEYSNETWNGMFKQAHYCVAEGTALKLDPKGKPDAKGAIWANGFRFHAWAAIRMFRAADLVFGEDSKRVVKVLATQTGSTFICAQHQAMMNDPQTNPWKTKATAIAAAPYFGNGVDGGAPDVVEKLRAAMQKSISGSAKLKQVADEAKLLLIAYEGGQHVVAKAAAINRKPEMHDLYVQYLGEMSKFYSHFSHYNHVGQAGDRGAWGCMEKTGQPLSEAHKYRALVEWAKEHPRGK